MKCTRGEGDPSSTHPSIYPSTLLRSPNVMQGVHDEGEKVPTGHIPYRTPDIEKRQVVDVVVDIWMRPAKLE